MNLADEMRPQTFKDIVGQPHLTGDNSLLMKLVSSGDFDSLMFVGPPGTGKTSMARLTGEKLGIEFYSLHAATSGAAELKKISEIASRAQRCLVFIDEIHRYNKSQQDLLLKLIDDRSVCLIGASAENPYYNLVPALRSRSLIFTFKAVDEKSHRELAVNAFERLKIMLGADIKDPNDCIKELIKTSAGDVRRFLNLLELSALVGDRNDGTISLSLEGLAEMSSKRFDEDEYYDLLSAMIKSIRGSDPDSALLWGVKLVKSGVTPEAVFRRLMISASEDIGNAYPDAAVFVNSCYQSFMNVGYPEGLIILAHAIVFLASCPKSNRSYAAYNAVNAFLNENDPKVPRNVAHAAEGYKYPFDYGFFVNQRYSSVNEQFYFPSENGFESKIRDRLKNLWLDSKKYE